MAITIQQCQTTRADGGVLDSAFYLQERPTPNLAIIYPGAGYSCHGPVLYYLTNLLIDLGYDVLNVGYDFRVNPERSERSRVLLHDIRETYALAVSQRNYSRLLIGAKSIGTRGLAQHIENGLLADFAGKVGVIWLTAGWNVDESFQTMAKGTFPGLHVIGEADPLFNRVKAEILASVVDQQILTIPGADHGLEINGDVEASIAVLQEIVAAYRLWLKNFGK